MGQENYWTTYWLGQEFSNSCLLSQHGQLYIQRLYSGVPNKRVQRLLVLGIFSPLHFPIRNPTLIDIKCFIYLSEKTSAASLKVHLKAQINTTHQNICNNAAPKNLKGPSNHFF